MARLAKLMDRLLGRGRSQQQQDQHGDT
jgi:hypothetical protein